MLPKSKFALQLLATGLLVWLATAAFAADPGLPIPANSELSDQKTGSVLFYNFYASSSSSPNLQNTRISLTNTSASLGASVHLFFVEGATGASFDSFICLTTIQTTNFLASEIDPGVAGYLIAVAVDSAGCPINFNFLAGAAHIKLGTGHEATIGAEAFAAIASSPATCSGNSATLNFDGVNYNRAPRALAINKLRSVADKNSMLLVINRFGGNLASGASALTSMTGILYDDAQNRFDFDFSPGTSQFRSILSNNFPQTSTQFESVIPAGRTGWMKFWSLNDQGILGAVFNFNPDTSKPNATNSPFNSGNNLHKLTLTVNPVTLTIPVFVGCNQ